MDITQEEREAVLGEGEVREEGVKGTMMDGIANVSWLV
jgi:hypothetical protein